MSLNKGTCWDILEISHSNDKKVVKRAYHKLLRKYKPDEHPEEFQILYQAYQDALISSNDISFEPIGQSIEIETEINTIIPLEASNKTVSQKEVTPYELFTARVDALTYDNEDIDIFNNFSNWNFIEKLGFSEDLHYHKQYAQYLFDAINYIDKKFKNHLLSSDIITYLNHFFLWNNNWKNYSQNSSIFEYLQNKPISHFANPKYLSMKIKLLSIFIDIFITVAISIWLTHTIYIEPIITSIYYFFIYGILFVWFGVKTPGQYIMKLNVLEQGNHILTGLSDAAAIIRHFLTCISIYTSLEFFYNPLSISSLILILNLYFLYTKRLLIQDLWGTKVYLITK